MLVVLVSLALLTAAATTTYFARRTDRGPAPSAADREPTPAAPPRPVVLTYEVQGKGRAIITYTDPAQKSNVVLPDQPLPWRIELPRQVVDFAQVNARRTSSESAPWTSRIVVDGAEVCSQTLDLYINTGCQYLPPSS
ncbi:MmpS family transport accessory protein [Micromonospora zhanjiangensis]